jgi:hypothetical protein
VIGERKIDSEHQKHIQQAKYIIIYAKVHDDEKRSKLY